MYASFLKVSAEKATPSLKTIVRAFTLDPEVGYSLAEKDGDVTDFRNDWLLMTKSNRKEHKHDNRHCTSH